MLSFDDSHTKMACRCSWAPVKTAGANEDECIQADHPAGSPKWAEIARITGPSGKG